VKFRSLKNSLFNIRLVQQQDINYLAEILAISFYFNSRSKFSVIMQWFYPLVRWGISLELSSRVGETNPSYVCLVAADDSNSDRAIATLEMSLRNIPQRTHSLNILDWRTVQYPYVANLAVHPQWRRQGLATQLLEASEQQAKHWGFQQIYLHVLEDNHAARELYTRVGYQFYKADPELSFCPWLSPQRLLLRKILT